MLTRARSASGHAPALEELPPDYHARLELIEQDHWWQRGMRELSAALLGVRLRLPGQSVLDAGCGAGGFLRWLLDHGQFAGAVGIDAVPEAIERARRRVPEADLRVCLLPELPFPPGSFDLVACNDVLQHLDADAAEASLVAFARVLRPGGALLVRTSGATRVRGGRASWGAYSRDTLRHQLEASGFACERVTHANFAPSLVADARRRGPATLVARQGHGIPEPSGRFRARLGAAWLAFEAQLISRTDISLPYGHTLLAVAVAAPAGSG